MGLGEFDGGCLSACEEEVAGFLPRIVCLFQKSDLKGIVVAACSVDGNREIDLLYLQLKMPKIGIGL
jgi:hypothetical protein